MQDKYSVMLSKVHPLPHWFLSLFLNAVSNDGTSCDHITVEGNEVESLPRTASVGETKFRLLTELKPSKTEVQIPEKKHQIIDTKFDTDTGGDTIRLTTLEKATHGDSKSLRL